MNVSWRSVKCFCHLCKERAIFCATNQLNVIIITTFWNQLYDICCINFVYFSDLLCVSADPKEPKLLQDPVILKLAAKHKVSPAVICIRYQIERGIIVIPKSVTISRIQENFKVMLKYFIGSWFEKNL